MQPHFSMTEAVYRQCDYCSIRDGAAVKPFSLLGIGDSYSSVLYDTLIGLIVVYNINFKVLPSRFFNRKHLQ